MKRKRDIYMVTLADNEIHRLTSHEKDSSMPRESHGIRGTLLLAGRLRRSVSWFDHYMKK